MYMDLTGRFIISTSEMYAFIISPCIYLLVLLYYRPKIFLSLHTLHMPDKTKSLFRIIPKNLAIRLYAERSDAACVLDQRHCREGQSTLDSVIPSGTETFIVPVQGDPATNFEARLEVYDQSASPEILIGRLILKVAQGVFEPSQWLPVSADYTVHLLDFLYPPASLSVFRLPSTAAPARNKSRSYAQDI